MGREVKTTYTCDKCGANIQMCDEFKLHIKEYRYGILSWFNHPRDREVCLCEECKSKFFIWLKDKYNNDDKVGKKTINSFNRTED